MVNNDLVEQLKYRRDQHDRAYERHRNELVQEASLDGANEVAVLTEALGMIRTRARIVVLDTAITQAPTFEDPAAFLAYLKAATSIHLFDPRDAAHNAKASGYRQEIEAIARFLTVAEK